MSAEMRNEIDLLKASTGGDTVAFEPIVKEYQSFICAITFSATGDVEKSEELAQETFVSAWKDLGQLEDLSKFRSWLAGIARNIVKNSLRSRRRDPISKAVPIDEIEDAAGGYSEPFETAIDKEQQVFVRRALQRIPEIYREPLVLFYRQEQSVKEVAKQLELSEDTVKQRLSRGRNLLKEEVTGMVETTLSRNGPTTAFTAAVVASIAGIAAKASSAAAATASTTGVTGTGAAVTAAASGLTAKIIAVAAVLAIGAAAVITYKRVTSQTERPQPTDTVPNISQADTSAPPDRVDTGTNIAPDNVTANSKTVITPEPPPPPHNADSDPTPPPPPAETETKEFVFEPKGAHSGQLKHWEIAYYEAGIERIRRFWSRTAKRAGRGRDGRTNEPYPIYLVIDSLKPAMWLETAGQIDPNHYTELPKNMKWKLYRTSPDGNEDLGPVIRLKIRGLSMSQTFPEKVCVHSYGRGPGHFSIYITPGNVSTNYGSSGTFVIDTSKGQFTEGVDYFDSIVVGEKEYVDSIDSVKGLANEIAQLKSDVDSELPRNLANWLEAEKQIHMQIERQVLMTGLEVLKMRVTTGPDCTAGHAEVSVLEYSAFENRLRRSRPAWVYLKIDYLGKDVWYLRSAANPGRGLKSLMLPDEPLQLEFLVTAEGPLLESESQTWLEKGRSIQPVVVKTDLAYSATLPNGATVEFFGICSNPSAGRQWWAPDGSLLEHPLYYNAEAYGWPREDRQDRQIYEMAWRISGGRRVSTSFVVTGDPETSIRHVTSKGPRITQGMEGEEGSYYHLMQDRYGNDLDDLNTEGYAFKKDRKQTTWKVGVGAGDEEMQWVEFRNISLVPGENFGFEIVQVAAISK